MIQKIRIQNFRSIQDATVELGKVNLFIGPNNSGKSNMLRGIELMVKYLERYPNDDNIKNDLDEMVFRDAGTRKRNNKVVIKLSTDVVIYNDKFPTITVQPMDRDDVFKIDEVNNDKFFVNPEIETHDKHSLFKEIREELEGINIFRPDPTKFLFSVPIKNAARIDADGANIISFLFNLSQNYKKRFQQLEADLAACVVDLISLSTPADPNEPGKLKLKFFDTQDRAFWAEEVSEGVLYFLALLCVVHQPDPPKLLLLEEPEKGIHPRRIREVMNFIFQLAEERDIQIIMTSHSPYVVDHFADIPECISVFDKEDGATVIRNAARDILEPLNKRNAEQNLPPVQYTDSLGEHWVSGFLGGVPL